MLILVGPLTSLRGINPKINFGFGRFIAITLMLITFYVSFKFSATLKIKILQSHWLCYLKSYIIIDLNFSESLIVLNDSRACCDPTERP